jgi:hypothetical protein
MELRTVEAGRNYVVLYSAVARGLDPLPRIASKASTASRVCRAQSRCIYLRPANPALIILNREELNGCQGNRLGLVNVPARHEGSKNCAVISRIGCWIFC